MHRGARLRAVVFAGILCVLCSAVTFIARAEKPEIAVIPRPVQLHAAALDLGPGPLPPRRGLAPKEGVTPAHSTDQASLVRPLTSSG